LPSALRQTAQGLVCADCRGVDPEFSVRYRTYLEVGPAILPPFPAQIPTNEQAALQPESCYPNMFMTQMPAHSPAPAIPADPGCPIAG